MTIPARSREAKSGPESIAHRFPGACDGTLSESRGIQTRGDIMRKLFSEIPTIVGDGVVLSPLVETDAAALQDLMDNKRVYRYDPAYLFERGFDSAEEVIAKAYGEIYERKESLFLAVRLTTGGELCGLAEFYDFRDEGHVASCGGRLREAYWGHGIASAVLACMVAYLFGQTDVETITASSMVDNLPSARLLEKNGFVRTARSVEEDWGYAEPVVVDCWALQKSAWEGFAS